MVILAPDGTAQNLTFAQIDARANQWGRALAAAGADIGSLVALGIPNSEHLVLAALGCWKIGAVPVPMRWDLPEWERSRVLAVIDPAVIVDEQVGTPWPRDAADQSAAPLPDAVSPNANGICSSGSTGLPKVILNSGTRRSGLRSTSFPFMAVWTPTAQPQTILVPAPMYHTNGFSPLTYLLGGDQLVVLEKFDAALVVDAIERYRSPTSPLRQRCWPASRLYPTSSNGISPASRGSCRALQ